MNTQEIANFIKTQLSLGTTRTEIEKILTMNRVAPQDISAAFDVAMAETGSKATPPPIPNTPPGLTGIGTNPSRVFPPPAMVLNSVDSVQAPPAPITPPPAPIQPPSPPPAPSPIMPSRTTNPAPIIVTQTSSGGLIKWILILIILILLGIIGTATYAVVAKPVWATPLLNLLQPTLVVIPPETLPVVTPIINQPIMPTPPMIDYSTTTASTSGITTAASSSQSLPSLFLTN